jgi:hypothetical protein
MSQHHALRAAAGASVADEYFNRTVLLLQGNGSNGGQNNTFTDSSTNAFSITRNGNTTQGTFSPFSAPDGRWSNYFDGDGDYLSISNNSALQLGSGDYTVEAWVWLERITNTYNSNICGTLAFTGSDVGWSLGISTTGYPNFMSFNTGSGGFVITSSSTIPANRWVHLAAVRSGTSVKLYMDGVQVASGTSSINEAYTGAFAVGSNYVNFLSPNTGNSQVSIKGYISNVRVIKGSAQYTSAFTPSASPLTAITNTSLLTCQSNRFLDNSSNAFAITPYGNAAVTSFSPFAPTAEYQSSTNGGSGYFDGSGDYLSFPTNSSFDFGSGDFTVEMWFYSTNASGDGLLYLSGLSTSYAGFRLAPTYLLMSTNGSSWLFTDLGWTANINSWNHLAVTRSGSTLRVFMNGVIVGTKTISGSLYSSGTQYTTGRYQENGSTYYYYSGFISELRLLKGTAQYTAAFTPPTAPLTAITNTSLLLNFVNGSILDSTARNDLETVGDAQISTSTKKYGTGSLKFDGTGDALTIASNSNLQLGSSDFTVECWVNFTAIPSASGAATFVSQWRTSPSNNLSYFFYIFNSAGTYQLYLSYSTTGSNQTNLSVNLASAPSTGTWYHVAFVRNGSNFLVFWNGTQVGSTQTLSATLYNSTANVLIGGQEASSIDYPLNGYIDDLRVTKYARYTANFTPPTRQLPAR